MNILQVTKQIFKRVVPWLLIHGIYIFIVWTAELTPSSIPGRVSAEVLRASTVYRLQWALDMGDIAVRLDVGTSWHLQPYETTLGQRCKRCRRSVVSFFGYVFGVKGVS